MVFLPELTNELLMHIARLNLFVCLYVCLNGLYFYVLGLCVMSLLYVGLCVRCKTLCIIGGQHDGLCPFWQPARSIFTVLLCCVFSRANKLSLSHCIRKVYMLLLEGSEMLSSYRAACSVQRRRIRRKRWRNKRRRKDKDDDWWQQTTHAHSQFSNDNNLFLGLINTGIYSKWPTIVPALYWYNALVS